MGIGELINRSAEGRTCWLTHSSDLFGLFVMEAV